MSRPVSNLDEILRLDRAHVVHPITEFRKQEQSGSKIFVGGRGVELRALPIFGRQSTRQR